LRPHPNVCDLLGVCTNKQNPICIVTELLSEGSLTDLFNSSKIFIDAGLAVTVAKDIASGMSHLHRENILHCDLAARNLLVSLKGKDQYIIKVADFGLSHTSESDNYNLKAEAKFPIRWAAPEVMTRAQVSKAADVWSFGVVVWEILEWKKPYEEIQANNDVMKKVCTEGLRLKRPTRIAIPDRLWEIMQSCWSEDPKTRPTFQDLYKQLGELEASMSTEQKLDPTPSNMGGEWNYIRSPLNFPQQIESPQWSKAQPRKSNADEDHYLQTPRPNIEGDYNQTPAPKQEDNGYGQTPGIPLDNKVGYATFQT